MCLSFKKVDQEDLKRMNADQKDFRANLKKSESPEKSPPIQKTAEKTAEKTVKNTSSKPPSTQIAKPKREISPEKDVTTASVKNGQTSNSGFEEKEDRSEMASEVTRESNSPRNSAGGRKRKPKITKFPSEIIEAQSESSFDISLQVNSLHSFFDTFSTTLIFW